MQIIPEVWATLIISLMGVLIGFVVLRYMEYRETLKRQKHEAEEEFYQMKLAQIKDKINEPKEIAKPIKIEPEKFEVKTNKRVLDLED